MDHKTTDGLNLRNEPILKENFKQVFGKITSTNLLEIPIVLIKIGLRYLGALFFFLMPCVLYGQAIPTKLWGSVKNISGEVMDFASVVVANPQSPNKILASAYTDEQGKYQMVVRCNSDSLLLRVSRIEMKPIIMKIPNQSGEYNVVADAKGRELREVTVKAKKIGRAHV